MQGELWLFVSKNERLFCRLMAATPPTTFFSAKKVVKETHRLKLCYKWSCINVQAANFLGDILAERRAFTFNRT